MERDEYTYRPQPRLLPPQSPGQPTQPSGSADSSVAGGRRSGTYRSLSTDRQQRENPKRGGNRSVARLKFATTTLIVPPCFRHPGVILLIRTVSLPLPITTMCKAVAPLKCYIKSYHRERHLNLLSHPATRRAHNNMLFWFHPLALICFSKCMLHVLAMHF